MTRRSVAGATYPPDWKDIAHRVKSDANWTCVRCGVRHDPPDHILTVHHLDLNPSNSKWVSLLTILNWYEKRRGKR